MSILREYGGSSAVGDREKSETFRVDTRVELWEWRTKRDFKSVMRTGIFHGFRFDLNARSVSTLDFPGCTEYISFAAFRLSSRGPI